MRGDLLSSKFNWDSFEEHSTKSPDTAFNWDEFSPEKNETIPEESKLKSGVRQGLGLAARAGENAIGGYGNLLEAANKGINQIQKLRPYAKKINPFVSEEIPEPEKPKFNLPTTEKLRGFTQKLTGDYLEPQTEGESKRQEIAEDVGSFSTPGIGLFKIPTRIGLSIGSNLLADQGEKFGISRGNTKLATTFLWALKQGKTAKEVGNNLYKEADALLPPNATVKATSLTKNINELKNNLLKSAKPAPSEKAILDEINAINKIVDKSGNINIGRLQSTLRSMNERSSAAYYDAVSKGVPRKEAIRAKRLYGNLNHEINDTLAKYQSQNPEWYKTFKDAQEVHGVIAQSNKAREWIKKNATKGLVAETLLYPIIGAKAGIGASLAGIGAAESGRLMYQISKSPILRDHYAKALYAASKENANLFINEMKKIDKELKKIENKDKQAYQSKSKD